MPKNKMYRQGIDRVAQSIRGLQAHYDTFFRFDKNPYPFAFYHGVDMDTAWKMLDCRHLPTAEERMRACVQIARSARYYRKRWAKGGRNSAKTFTAAYTFVSLMVHFEDNMGIVLRHSWKNVDQTVIKEILKIVDIVTDGNPSYLLRIPGRRRDRFVGDHQGYKDMYFFTRGKKNSYALFLPEPDDADPRAVADALKSPQGGLGVSWIDELSETREIVDSTLEDNLRRDVPVKASLATTNPFTKGTWGYRLSREQEAKTAQGQSPRILILPSSMYDNPFADQDNIRAMENKYRDDPVEYRLQIEGKDVIPLQGKPVFKKHFNRKLHVNPDLRCNPMRELYVGIDWGYHHPAAVFAQDDDFGRWNILGELVLEDTGLKQFSIEIFTYLKRHYPNHYYDPNTTARHQRRVNFWCDPAGDFKRDRGDTTIEEMQEYGILCNFQMDSRFPEMRANNIRNMLDTIVQGRPVLQIHPRCSVMVDGFEYGYHYRVSRSGKVGETPHKDGYFEHPFDGAGYLFMGVYGHIGTTKVKNKKQVRAGMTSFKRG